MFKCEGTQDGMNCSSVTRRYQEAIVNWPCNMVLCSLAIVLVDGTWQMHSFYIHITEAYNLVSDIRLAMP